MIELEAVGSETLVTCDFPQCCERYTTTNATLDSILKEARDIGWKVEHDHDNAGGLGTFCGEHRNWRDWDRLRDSLVKPEMVHHPKHYNMGKFEVIDVIDDWKLGFALGNSVKYIARAAHKGSELEDLKKAAWYLNHEIERLETTKVDDGYAHAWGTKEAYTTLCSKPVAPHLMCGNDALDKVDCPACVAQLKKDGFRK